MLESTTANRIFLTWFYMCGDYVVHPPAVSDFFGTFHSTTGSQLALKPTDRTFQSRLTASKQKRAGGFAFVTWYVRNRSANEGDGVRLPIVNHIVSAPFKLRYYRQGELCVAIAVGEAVYMFHRSLVGRF